MRVDERARLGAHGVLGHLGKRDLPEQEVAVQRGAARVVERLLDVALYAAELGVHGIRGRRGVVARDEARRGDGRLHLVHPGLHVLAVLALAPALAGHAVAHVTALHVERVVEEPPLREARAPHELGGEGLLVK